MAITFQSSNTSDIKTKSMTTPNVTTPNVTRVFEWKDSWKRLVWEDVYKFTLSDIFSGQIRLMFEVIIDNRKFYVVTHDSDAEALHLKYPDAPIVNMMSLHGFLKRASANPEWLELVPKVLVALDVFEGAEAEIVKNGE